LQRLDAVIGLGANLGDRRATLQGAVRRLAAIAEVVAVSSLYETVPVGGPPQPAYLNAAIRLSYEGSPRALLAALLAIERDAGRERRERWGPRILDLDILWIRGVVCSEPGLAVPHPRLRERAFALYPLRDVAADARDPSDGMFYTRVLDDLGAAGVAELEQSWVAEQT
jgi:2-amino-4-hydroxy-6-hydroxymethyldihydropteridine diphosphokinase